MGGEHNLGVEMRVFQMDTERPAFVLDRLSSFLSSPLDGILRSRIADDPRQAETPAAARELFGESRLPTLAQYDPISRFFECMDGSTLAVTGDNSAPLMRYHIADQGGIIPHGEMLAFLKDWGDPTHFPSGVKHRYTRNQGR